jgi:hypothetical protein
MIVLKHDYRVILEVSHVDGFPLSDHLRMLPDHKPAHVSKEEPAVSIVRIPHSMWAPVVIPAPKNW